jgi:hypothetical protein
MKILQLLRDAAGFCLLVAMCWGLLVIVAATAEAQYNPYAPEVTPMKPAKPVDDYVWHMQRQLQEQKRQTRAIEEQNRILRQQQAPSSTFKVGDSTFIIQGGKATMCTKVGDSVMCF